MRYLYRYAPDGSIVAAMHTDQDIQADHLLAMPDPMGGGLVWAEGVARPGLDWRAPDGRILERLPNPAHADGRILRDLPAPCIVMVPGADHAVEESEVEIEFDTPGPWKVTVTGRVDYLDITLEIEDASNQVNDVPD